MLKINLPTQHRISTGECLLQDGSTFHVVRVTAAKFGVHSSNMKFSNDE
jgi:hypothetical protein